VSGERPICSVNKYGNGEPDEGLSRTDICLGDGRHGQKREDSARGVDRLKSWYTSIGSWALDRLGGNSGFEDGDALWSSLMEGIKADLKQANGGQDVATVPEETTYRPDWDEVAKLYDDPNNDAAVLNSLGCD